MLKRKLITFLILICSIIYLSNVTYASNQGIVYLSSNEKQVNLGEEIEITVNLENNKIAACNFYIYFEDEKLEFISNLNQEVTTVNTNLIGNRISYVWFDSLGGQGAKEGNIVSFKFRAKEKGIVTFSIDGEFYNQYGQLIQVNFKEEQVQIGKEDNLQEQTLVEQGSNLESANCDLKVLRVDKEGLVPNFEKDIQEYYLTVPKDIIAIDVLAVSDNPNALVEIDGNVSLQKEENDIRVKVISQDKTQSKVYIIHVTKTDNLDLANTNLEILAIENILLNPPFDTSELNYETEVSNQTESLNILAVPENEQATVQIIGKDNLKEGNNLVTVIVKAQNGITERRYKIKVNKRNLAQEEKHEEEQAKKKEDLENAYKVEKTSVSINHTEEKITNKEDKNNKTVVIWIISIVVVSLVVGGVIWKIRKGPIK